MAGFWDLSFLFQFWFNGVDLRRVLVLRDYTVYLRLDGDDIEKIRRVRGYLYVVLVKVSASKYLDFTSTFKLNSNQGYSRGRFTCSNVLATQYMEPRVIQFHVEGLAL